MKVHNLPEMVMKNMTSSANFLSWELNLACLNGTYLTKWTNSLLESAILDKWFIAYSYDDQFY